MRKLVLLAVGVGVWLGLGLSGKAQEDESRAVIEKAIEAHGGAKVLAGIKAMQMKGKGKAYQPMEFTFTIDVSAVPPSKYKVEVDVEINNMNIKVIKVFNGDKGWLNVLGKTTDLGEVELKEFKEMAHVEKVTSLIALREKAYKLSPLGESKVEGRDAVGVQVTTKDRRDVNLFFDKKSHLLVKAEYRALDEATKQEVTQEKILLDYKKGASGLRSPTKMIINNDGKKFLEAEITEVTTPDSIDDSNFAKP